MSGFSPAQLKKLTGKLDRSCVQSRTVEGKSIDYIEGWFALSEANAIFGFANWDRETVHFERLFERTRGEMTTCSYSARVRVRVRAGDQTISREGTGCGTASARNAADAHERAIKAAETDATKRALATFGNRFGLCLYDKDQAGVSEPAGRPMKILCPNGKVFADSLSPEGFCTALRKIIENTSSLTELSAWQERNALAIASLRTLAPKLKAQRGEHYADVLERLFQTRISILVVADRKVGKKPPASFVARVADPPQALESAPAHTTPDLKTERAEHCAEVRERSPEVGLGHLSSGTVDFTERLPSSANTEISHALYTVSDHRPLAPSRIAYGPRIDKGALTFNTTRRCRDKAHLRQVATLPCLVCKSTPSNAHHLTFAQPRGLALKVSDEFVVLHHSELHRSGAEHLWWKRTALDPLAIAKQLWEARAGGVEHKTFGAQ
jgi:DNA recombination protein Rad52